NLFHDYLKTDLSAVKTEGTAFKVEGAFITPPDQMVYYTSDMDAFKASQNMPLERFTWQDHTIDINPAKIRGHYLFYDSDLDGFMETVFILSPDDDSNGVYDVVSIGYNYDGDYNFIPYERVGSNRESRTFLTFGESYEFIPNRNQHNPIPRGDSTFWYEDFYPYFVDLLYPTDITGEYISKDPIFEVWRLMPTGESINPLLFYQAKTREYAEAWSIYEGQLWQEIWDQVNMIVIAGTVSAGVAATGVGAPFAALTFAATYFLLSLANNEEKKREMRQQMKARIYYPVDSVRNAPVVISDKRRSDYADIWEHWQGHQSAKYATISGGEPGNLFIGEAVVVLPGELRGEGLSLDYFFMTNEIIGYNNRDGYMVTAAEGYGDILNYETNRNYLAFKYRTNTLGYLENNVEELSNGQFNRIKPLAINGRPAYIFVDEQAILPPRGYLGPIVVNPDRYSQIGSREHIISVDVDNIGASADIPLRGYSGLKEGYKSRIELSDNFNFPISKITIDVLEPTDYFSRLPDNEKAYFTNTPDTLALLRYQDRFGYNQYLHSLEDMYTVLEDPTEIKKSLYTVKDGYLYFTTPIENIVFGNDNPYKGDLNVFFRVNIHVPTVVSSESLLSIPYIPSINTIHEPIGPPISYAQSDLTGTISKPLEPSSDNLARVALTQATSFLITDYFNAFTHGAAWGYSKAEVKFLWRTTALSTLISSLILVPVTLGASAIAGSFQGLTHSAIAKEALKQLAGAFISVLNELYEESYIDPMIERLISDLGGPDWLSSL
ncbi:MAG: hypothetical protein ACW99Q_25080, partial [Candidatus Kariarchaeaceae archaeon]